MISVLRSYHMRIRTKLTALSHSRKGWCTWKLATHCDIIKSGRMRAKTIVETRPYNDCTELFAPILEVARRIREELAQRCSSSGNAGATFTIIWCIIVLQECLTFLPSLAYLHVQGQGQIKCSKNDKVVVLSACYRRLRSDCFRLTYIIYCLSPRIPFPVSCCASPSGSAAHCYGMLKC